MIDRAGRVITVAVLALSTAALAGCSHSPDSTAADGCSPARPHVSQDVVRPGDEVTVSVSAVTCRPTFDHDRDLVLSWRDRSGHSARLATVRAYPSGAFEKTVRLPKDIAVGDGSIEVAGVEVPCPDTGSCAAYDAYVDVVDSTPDFASSAHANRVAADIADRMSTALEHRSSFAELAIVPDGVEVVLHTTRFDAEDAAAKQAFETARSAAPSADRALAGGAHLHVVFIQHRWAALHDLTTRIAHDTAWQKQHRIELSGWGADTATDSVRIALRTYTDAAAVLLVRRYGTAVTVSTTDTPYGEAF